MLIKIIKNKVLWFITFFILLTAFLYPIDAGCGAPNMTCSSGLDPDGYYSYQDVTEPAGIYMIELILNTDIKIEYQRVSQSVKYN